MPGMPGPDLIAALKTGNLTIQTLLLTSVHDPAKARNADV
jgi:hypothetical protein